MQVRIGATRHGAILRKRRAIAGAVAVARGSRSSRSGEFGRRVVEGEELEDVAQVALAAGGAAAGVDALLGEELGDVGGIEVCKAEQGAALRQVLLAPPTGEQAVVADLVEARR